MPKILIAECMQEVSSFNPLPSGYEGFHVERGEELRAQLQGRATFDGTFDTLETIEFRELSVTDATDTQATVALRTVARHTTFTDRCTGTAQATRGGGDATWRVGRLGVACT